MTEYSCGNCVQFCARNDAQPELAEVRGEEEREEDRGDAEQPADRALDEAEDEHPEQEQDDQQVDDVDRSSASPRCSRPTLVTTAVVPGRPEPRRRVAARDRLPQRDRAASAQAPVRARARSIAPRTARSRPKATARGGQRGDDRRDGGLDLGLGERPVAAPRSGAGRRGSSRPRRAGRRGRCRTGGRPAARSPAVRRRTAGDGRGERRLRRRRPRDRARPPGGGRRRGRARAPGGPPARPARASSATITRWAVRRSQRVDERRVELADERARGGRRQSRGPRRPGWSSGSAASGAYVGRAEAEAAREQLDHALGVVEVVRARAGGSRRRARRRRRARTRGATTRAASSPVRAVALADLEDGDVLACRGAGSWRRPRAGCRAGSGAAPSARARAGCVTAIGPPPGWSSPPTGGTSRSRTKRLDVPGRRARSSRPRSARRRRASRGRARGPRAATGGSGGIGVSGGPTGRARSRGRGRSPR